MRWLSVFCLLASVAHGQLSVQLKAEKETLLVYEPIPVTVLIRNFSARTIELTSEADRSWLGFVVLDESGSMMPALGSPKDAEPVLIAPGQTVSRTIDILPLYDIRARGTYRVQAKINSGNTSVMSAPIALTMINGREIWTQTVGLPAPEGQAEEYRTYILLARRAEREDLLHVCVRDDQHQVVYGVIALGGFITVQSPEARIDKQGHLHVLYQVGPRSYGYAHIDPYARIVERAAYSDYLSRPGFVVNDGEVTVKGGEKTGPESERVMSAKELKRPPPPPPKPKRHWWWPFGKGSTPPPAK